jgi:hypothetical protein
MIWTPSRCVTVVRTRCERFFEPNTCLTQVDSNPFGLKRFANGAGASILSVNGGLGEQYR